MDNTTRGLMLLGGLGLIGLALVYWFVLFVGIGIFNVDLLPKHMRFPSRLWAFKVPMGMVWGGIALIVVAFNV